MENLVFTQLSIPEIRQIFRQELQTFFQSQSLAQPPIEQEQLLTIQQAAEFLSLSVPTIYGLVSKSQLPVNKKGNRLYFTKQELTEWVKAGRKKTAAEIELTAQKYTARKGV